LGVAGIGFDAEVGWSFAQAAKRGFTTYFMTALKMLPGYRTSAYELCLDGEKLSRNAFLISFANSSQFGNGASISPQAKINDGLLDVVIIRKFPFYATFEMVYRLFNRSLHHSKYVEIIRCKEIDLAQPNVKAHIDGEPVFFQDGMRLRIIPSSLKIIVPGKETVNPSSHELRRRLDGVLTLTFSKKYQSEKRHDLKADGSKTLFDHFFE
jgi:diacylglycerol kinase family enzyme